MAEYLAGDGNHRAIEIIQSTETLTDLRRVLIDAGLIINTREIRIADRGRGSKNSDKHIEGIGRSAEDEAAVGRDIERFVSGYEVPGGVGKRNRADAIGKGIGYSWQGLRDR